MGRSDSSTAGSSIVEDSTDGDDALEADDTWVLTSDDGSVDDDATSDVVNRTAIGTRHSITSYPTFTTGSLQARFTFKVKPGKTVKLLFIQQFENSIAAAAGDDADFQNLTTLIAAGFPLSGSFHNWVP